ncbi:MAG TPA: hypothetical protein VF911_02070 [Thermoanaerobaculia bacterium]|jgi:hypothetical protein
MVRLARVLAAAIAVLVIGANALTAGEARVTLVPWEVVDPGESVDAPLVLFWIPATRDELRRSDLLSSYDLTVFSSRCVAMRVVRFTDSARLTSLGVGADVPMAVLTDAEGNVLGRVEADGHTLPVTEVEDLVREELEHREAEAEALLDRARDYAEDGQLTAAIAVYERILTNRCIAPRQARDAKRALKKLARR